jgi:glycerophosphoryl diester phosphodiesterase
MAYLKTLDVGYGYTADGGKTFPLRGTGRGLIPSLDEVFARFPVHAFLIDLRSNDARDGERLAARLAELPRWRRNLITVYGAEPPISALRARVAGLRLIDARTERRCLRGYVTVGWSGYVPSACRNSVFVVPSDYDWMLWGWPWRLHRRMDDVDVPIVFMPPLRGTTYTPAIDTVEGRRTVPYEFGFLTNRIEVTGPAWRNGTYR